MSPDRSASSGLSPIRRQKLVRLFRFGLLAAIAAVMLTSLGIVLYTAEQAVHPPRLKLVNPPTSVGIEHYEDVSFVTTDGLTLRGWYVPSRNTAAVIVCHGFGTNRSFALKPASILAEQGFGVLLFDWRAHGLSDGDTVTFGQLEMEDLDAAIAFVAARPDVRADRIGALGISMGGAVVTRVAARNAQLKAVVVEVAYPSFEEVLTYKAKEWPVVGPIGTWWTKMRAGVDLDAVRPVDEICAISPRPVLLIYGTEDGMIPPDSGERMAAAACEPKTLWLVEGGNHWNYPVVAGSAYDERLLAFFGQLLR